MQVYSIAPLPGDLKPRTKHPLGERQRQRREDVVRPRRRKRASIIVDGHLQAKSGAKMKPLIGRQSELEQVAHSRISNLSNGFSIQDLCKYCQNIMKVRLARVTEHYLLATLQARHLSHNLQTCSKHAPVTQLADLHKSQEEKAGLCQDKHSTQLVYGSKLQSAQILLPALDPLFYSQMVERSKRLLQGNEGGLLFLEGEAGLGKTRLMEEFKSTVMSRLRNPATQRHMLIFSGKGDEASTGQVNLLNKKEWPGQHLKIVSYGFPILLTSGHITCLMLQSSTASGAGYSKNY